MSSPDRRKALREKKQEAEEQAQIDRIAKRDEMLEGLSELEVGQTFRGYRLIEDGELVADLPGETVDGAA